MPTSAAGSWFRFQLHRRARSGSRERWIAATRLEAVKRMTRTTSRYAQLSFSILVVGMMLLGMPARASAADLKARIKALDLTGMAPFTVQVHGLESDVPDDLQTRYQWDFGDPGSAYNKLEGWNAAHLYRQPGQYIIRLKVTDASGHVSQAARTVHVEANTRRNI